MSPDVNLWVDIVLRWAHVIAGIMWVGTTFYFTWLDGRFAELEKAAKQGQKSEHEVWMVHSGGFYLMAKQSRPQLLPQVLHWFKWEAAFTWLTGFLLFGFLYWHGAQLTGFDETVGDRWRFLFPKMAQPAALTPLLNWITNHYILASLAMIVVGWMIYDLLWGRLFKDGWAGTVVAFVLIVLATIFSCVAFAGRGAYLQMGAILGTIMAANVWMRILPPQRRMVAALKAGREPDLSEGARAKLRSKHNTFIVIPVVFIMISNHYPLLYGSRHNWAILSGLVLAGWIAAKFIRRA